MLQNNKAMKCIRVSYLLVVIVFSTTTLVLSSNEPSPSNSLQPLKSLMKQSEDHKQNDNNDADAPQYKLPTEQPGPLPESGVGRVQFLLDFNTYKVSLTT